MMELSITEPIVPSTQEQTVNMCQNKVLLTTHSGRVKNSVSKSKIYFVFEELRTGTFQVLLIVKPDTKDAQMEFALTPMKTVPSLKSLLFLLVLLQQPLTLS